MKKNTKTKPRSGRSAEDACYLRFTPAVKEIVRLAAQMADFHDDKLIRVAHIESALAKVQSGENANNAKLSDRHD